MWVSREHKIKKSCEIVQSFRNYCEFFPVGQSEEYAFFTTRQNSNEVSGKLYVAVCCVLYVHSDEMS